MTTKGGFPKLSAEEAARLIGHDAMVAFSGFTPAGAAKAVPFALAARARELHESGQPFQIRVLTGASTGHSLDDALAEADAISCALRISLPSRCGSESTTGAWLSSTCICRTCLNRCCSDSSARSTSR